MLFRSCCPPATPLPPPSFPASFPASLPPSLQTGAVEEDVLPAHMELLSSFHSLITSSEQLQSSYLLNPDLHRHAELATPPRKLLNTLR